MRDLVSERMVGADAGERLSSGDPLRGERALFFRHWLRTPLGIGAILPSGRAVARAMAREAALSRPGMVLELGGGTGSITRALLAAGCPPERLLVVERERELAASLHQRLPAVAVVEADAGDLDAVLREACVPWLAAVVSSLPIKWFPFDKQRMIVEACFARLSVGGALLQLTNALVSPLPMSALDLEGIEVARIWAHVPPVQIWQYRRQSPVSQSPSPRGQGAR